MNNLMFLIYLAGIGVFAALERQRDLQHREIAAEFERLGLTLPPSRPPIRTLESLLNISLGILLAAAGGAGAWMLIREPLVATTTSAGIWTFYSVLAAAGLTLLILGLRALVQNLRQRT